MDDDTRQLGSLRRPGGTPSRRGMLIAGGTLVVLGAAGGLALGLATGTENSGQLTPHVSAELAAAVDAERTLAQGVQAALATARGARRTSLRLVHADHLAHLAALEALIADLAYPASVPASPSSSSGSPSASGSSGAPAPGPRVAVGVAEARAARAAAARALRLADRPAALLASISASEATHAELLS